jgi:hypothetical protein
MTKVTGEVIRALDVLRAYALGGPETSQVVQAINTLDDADVFAGIDNERLAVLPAFDVVLAYKVVGNEERGVTTFRMRAEGEDNALLLAQKRLVDDLMKIRLISLASELEILKSDVVPAE